MRRAFLTSGCERSASAAPKRSRTNAGKLDGPKQNLATLTLNQKKQRLNVILMKITSSAPEKRGKLERQLFCPDHSIGLRVLCQRYVCPRIGCANNIVRPPDSLPPSRAPRKGTSTKTKLLPIPRGGDPLGLDDPLLRIAYADMKSGKSKSEKEVRAALGEAFKSVETYKLYQATLRRYRREDRTRHGPNFLERVPKGTIAAALRRAAVSGSGAGPAAAKQKTVGSQDAMPKGWQRQNLAPAVREQLRKASRESEE